MSRRDVLRPMPKVEQLEDRRHPAALTFAGGAFTYSAGDGIANHLTITQGATTFTFADTAETISCSVQGQSGSGTNTVTVPMFAPNTVINVLAKDKNDFVDASGVSVRTTLVGSYGDDTLIGGSGDDLIDGADG